MDSQLLNYLNKNKIKFIEHRHPAVFTVAEASNLDSLMPEVFHTKNLFLKDEAEHFFLVCMNAYKRLDIKNLKEKLNIRKKLFFASSEELKQKLNLTPGSVSVFGMINGQKNNVKLVMDKEVWLAKKVGFHPNINTSTLELTHENLEKFIETLHCEKLIIPLSQK